MLEHKLIKCEPDSPFRCQAVVKLGQCPFTAIENTKNCHMHTNGGVQAKAALTNYRLGKWQARLNELASSDAVKSLRDEIGIMRMTLEEIVNRCQDSNDLIIYSGKIADMATRIEKLVSSCHRLELSTGSLLDRQDILQLAANLVDIMTRHIPDQDVIDVVSEEITIAINSLNTVKEIDLVAG
jgi:hypothetical protein